MNKLQVVNIYFFQGYKYSGEVKLYFLTGSRVAVRQNDGVAR